MKLVNILIASAVAISMSFTPVAIGGEKKPIAAERSAVTQKASAPANGSQKADGNAKASKVILFDVVTCKPSREGPACT